MTPVTTSDQKRSKFHVLVFRDTLQSSTVSTIFSTFRQCLRAPAAGDVVAAAIEAAVVSAITIHAAVVLAADARAPVVADQRRRQRRALGSPAPTAASSSAAGHGRHGVVRGAGRGDRRVLGREPARAGRVRARVPRHTGGGRRGGHQAAAARERAGRPRVPRRGGDHQPCPPPPSRLPRRILHPRRPAPARLRVRAQQDARAPPARYVSMSMSMLRSRCHRLFV